MRRRRVSTSGAMKHSGQHGLDWIERALSFHRKLHKAILLVLLQTSRLATAGQRQTVVQRPSVLQQEVVTPMPQEWTIPTNLVKWYGRCNLQHVHDWWGGLGSPAWCMGTLLWCMYQAFSCSFHLTCIQASQDLGATRNGGILRNLMRHLKRVWLGARGANSSCYCFEVTWKGMVWCFLKRWPERTQPQWPHGSFATSWNGRPLWSTTLIGSSFHNWGGKPVPPVAWQPSVQPGLLECERRWAVGSRDSLTAPQ